MEENIVKKHYNLSNAGMLEKAKGKFDLFVADKADFLAFDSAFGGTFQNEWQTAILVAESKDSDKVVLTKTRILSEAVEAKMDLCRVKFQASKYFIELAFPDNFALWTAFGYEDYAKAKNNHAVMIQFMENFYDEANAHHAELMAVNYTQAMIDEIWTRMDELDKATRAQNTWVNSRKKMTQQRQIAYNKVWDTVVRICVAGQIIYLSDAAKREQYLIPSNSTNGRSHATKSFIIVSNQAVLSPVTVDYISVSAQGGEQVNNDWGDGNKSLVTMQSGVYTSVSHNFNIPDNYTLRITDLRRGKRGGVIAIAELRIIGGKVISIIIPANAGIKSLILSDNQIVNFKIPATVKLLIIKLDNNKLSVTSVNDVLVKADNSGLQGGIIDLSGGTNAAPNGIGSRAKNNLIGKGWTVTTN